MSYLVVVLPDRIKAEEAYLSLEGESFPMDKIEILGRGYKTPEEFGLIDPLEKVKTRAKRMAFWLMPFGFLGGVGFSLTTQLQTFAWAGSVGNHVLGGLMGVIGGAMGSFFIGGGPTLVLNRSSDGSYGDRIEAGKYLLAVNGPEILINQVVLTIRKFQPEAVEVLD